MARSADLNIQRTVDSASCKRLIDAVRDRKAFERVTPVTIRKPDPDRRAWEKQAGEALLAGADRIGLRQISHETHGNCVNPIYREQAFRQDKMLVGRIYRKVRCRRCTNCLNARARHWAHRIRYELDGVQGRTWFVTLTLNHQSQMIGESRARLKYFNQHDEYDTLSPKERFAALCAYPIEQLQLMLKRIRSSGSQVRYIYVIEPHKSGLPHVHMLLMETGGEPVSYRDIEAQWPLGFVKSKLVDVSSASEKYKAARYISKYLTKEIGLPIRNSQNFGKAKNVKNIIQPIAPIMF